MNLFVKMAGDLPVWQKCFFRNLVAGFIAVGMLIKKKERIVIPKGNFLPLALRCIGGTLGILCNFYAIGQMNIADASMLNKLSPFFGIILRPLQGSTFGALFYINFTLHSLCCKNTGCVFLH